MRNYRYYLSALALMITLVAMPLSNAHAVETHPFLTGQVKESSSSLNYENKKLIIQTSKGLTAAQLKKLGATVSQRISDLNYTVLQFKTEKEWKAAVKILSTTKGVKKISLSPIYKKLASVDPKSSQQYMHKLLKSADAQKLIGKTKVKVAIIDAGINLNHPDIKAQIVQSKNIANPLHHSVDDAHGTHVAGIIAATKNNGIGGYGINPTAQLFGYDVFDGQYYASEYIIAKAILQATKDGAKVINMSLGSPYSSYIMADAIRYARSKGVLVVAAAGNDGDSFKQYPASYEGVISVGSVNNDRKLSTFSSYGVSMDIVAPGEDIYSSSYQKKGSTFEKMSGTSMASPVVAAVASLILSKNPKLTPDQVEYILKHSATDLGDKGFDVKYGNGLVNPLAALKFNSKNIPSLTTKKWTDKEIVNDAVDAKFNATITDKFNTPSEEKWVRLAVTKGQKIQIAANGDKFADLKLAVNFYNDASNQKTTYNQAQENKIEAKYFEAPFDGTMAVGVSDINGLVSTNNYTLQILNAEFPEDESSRDTIREIESLNSIISDQYMQPIEDGDEDVLHFKATKDELVQIEVSAIPGVTTAIQVYDKNSFLPDEKTTVKADDDDEIIHDSIVEFNNYQPSSVSTVAFESKKGEDYYIVVNNMGISYLTFNLTLQMLLSGKDIELPVVPEASFFPYSVTLKSKDTPVDEDKLGTAELEEIEEPGEDDNLQTKYEQLGRAFDLSKVTTGYINGSNDLDGYYFTTKQSAIYQLEIKTALKSSIPYVRLVEVGSQLNDKNEPKPFFDVVADSYSEYYGDGTSMMMGLKANTTYLLDVVADGSIPFDGYSLQPKLLKNNSEDKHEPNNTAEKAVTIPASNSITANVATFNDRDYYYYTAKNTGIFSVDYKLKKLTTTEKSSFPEKLMNLYLPDVSIIQDKNNNKRLDDIEYESSFYLTDVSNDLSMHGSYEMTKNHNYFVAVTPYAYEHYAFSALPYELRLKQALSIDEDAKNIVKKNVPSKPITLAKKSAKTFEKTAYMNSGFRNGDTDWFVYTSTAKGKITVSLSLPRDLDGVLEVYKNGKRLAKSDYYGDGDSESLSLNVTKGKYYFKVTDRFKHASVDSYKLTIKK